MTLVLGLELTQEFLFGFFHVAEEFYPGVETAGIFLDTGAKFFGG